MSECLGVLPRTCLLIAPLHFYSFPKTLAEGLGMRGYHVDILNEEFPANILGRVIGSFALPIIRRITLRGLKIRLDARPQYDLVLIIKGRGIGHEAIAYLKKKARRIVAYNYDSFQRNPSPLDWYHLVDRYATFDIQDAATYRVPLVHLFSAVRLPVIANRAYDVSIIQRVHSNRLAYAELLLRSLPSGCNAFIYLYEWSLLTFVLGLLRNPLLYVRLWQYISFKPLGYMQAMMAMANSRVTFDYALPEQSGITIRCFEAQSLGVAVLTNNRAAVDSGIMSHGSIFHLPNGAGTDTVASLVAYLISKPHEPRIRSLDDFLDDLLFETSISASQASTIDGERS